MARTPPPAERRGPVPASQPQPLQQEQDAGTPAPQMQSGPAPAQPPRFRDWASI